MVGLTSNLIKTKLQVKDWQDNYSKYIKHLSKLSKLKALHVLKKNV